MFMFLLVFLKEIKGLHLTFLNPNASGRKGGGGNLACQISICTLIYLKTYQICLNILVRIKYSDLYKELIPNNNHPRQHQGYKVEYFQGGGQTFFNRNVRSSVYTRHMFNVCEKFSYYPTRALWQYESQGQNILC